MGGTFEKKKKKQKKKTKKKWCQFKVLYLKTEIQAKEAKEPILSVRSHNNL